MRDMPDNIDLPDVITAPRTDRIYNCHSYLTKVPIAAITPFLEQFTREGETVVDPFAGSGMTGIAAALKDRKAHLSDISVLGQHIARGYLTEVSHEQLKRAADNVICKGREGIQNLYLTRRESDQETVEMVRTVWSFTYVCPKCNSPLIYYRYLANAGGKPPDVCAKCEAQFSRRSWAKMDDVPVQIVLRDKNGRLIEQEPGSLDLKNIRKAMNDRRQDEVPSHTIDENREMYRRSALGKHGLTDTKRFFSPRNAIALLELWKAISQVKDSNIRRKLSFAFTAILPRASRRYQWGPKRPLNAQNQTYYIAPIYYEWNIFELFTRKINAAIRADEELFKRTPLFSSNTTREIKYVLSSADALSHLEDNSIDYVFTDPPFGSNIFYSDMNLFQEAWLGSITDHSCEAVMHTAGNKKKKSYERYESILLGAFKEAYRVLKPGKYMSVVFGNSNGSIWALVQRALLSAGFAAVPVHVAILDKGQRSVKGLNSGSEGVVTVDLVLTVRKPSNSQDISISASGKHGDAATLLEAAIRQLDTKEASNPSYIYAAVIREAIMRGERVDQLHLSDVLVALRNAGYSLDPKTGLLSQSS